MKKSSILAIGLIIATTFSFSGCSFDSLVLGKDKTKEVAAEVDKKTESTDTEKTDDEKFEAEKKAAEEKAAAEKKAAEEEKQTLIYKNEKLGFSLMLFDGWKDKYTVQETATSVSFNFKPSAASKTKSKLSGRIFTVIMNADKKITVDNPTWVKANGKDYLIGMPTDVTYEPTDPEYETFKKMSDQVSKIKATFKEYKATTSTAKPTSTTPASSEKFYGTWTIKKVAATGKVTTFNTTQQKQLIGKKFTFSATSAQSFGDTMNSVGKNIAKPNYKKTDITLDNFKQSQPTAYPKLGLQGKTITEVKVLDSNGAYQGSFYIKDDKTILLYGGGVFFEMSKN